MACNLYENATTLHAFAGIVNYRMNVDELLVSICSRESCLARWKNTDTLIIDEVSQLNRKTFEAIQILGQKTRDSCKPFGGIQIIAVGDFKQLPPVPSDLDLADFCFESPLWKATFKHHVVFTAVYGQEQQQFINFLSDIALGVISEHTQSIIEELTSKTLNPHIFLH